MPILSPALSPYKLLAVFVLSRLWAWYSPDPFVTFRENHPENVLSAIELIVYVVIDESDNISLDLLSLIIASVKKDNEVEAWPFLFHLFSYIIIF